MVKYNLNFVVSMFTMLASVHFYTSPAQTSYIVGDALGWTTPTNGSTVYTTWASLQTFFVGDILIFNFTSGKHDVAEVSATVYGPCTFTNLTTIVNSPASITLTTTGNHYYICTHTSHCQQGQKLSINVFPADENITPTFKQPITPQTPGILPNYPPISSPNSSPTTSPTITSDNTIPPPPTSTGEAQSFMAKVPVSFLTIGFIILGLLNL